jgi:hypothetical protein
LTPASGVTLTTDESYCLFDLVENSLRPSLAQLSLSGKLRQTCRSMRQTVQVLRTPHIHKKTCANGFESIST